MTKAMILDSQYEHLVKLVRRSPLRICPIRESTKWALCNHPMQGPNGELNVPGCGGFALFAKLLPNKVPRDDTLGTF